MQTSRFVDGNDEMINRKATAQVRHLSTSARRREEMRGDFDINKLQFDTWLSSVLRLLLLPLCLINDKCELGKGAKESDEPSFRHYAR